jgi:hypothetical protein
VAFIANETFNQKSKGEMLEHPALNFRPLRTGKKGN